MNLLSFQVVSRSQKCRRALLGREGATNGLTAQTKIRSLYISALDIPAANVMQSLAQEIKSFSKTNLRKQCTRVTTLSGRRIIETWRGSTVQVVEETVQPETACGYVQDNNWDLQVGYIKPYLLLGE